MIKLIQTKSGKLYAYDSITNKIITLNLTMNHFPPPAKIEKIVCKLQDTHLIQDIPLTCVEWKHSFHSYWQIVERSIPKMVIQMTTDCNLNCKYCDVSGMQSNKSHKPRSISKETVKTALDFYMQHSVDCEKTAITFFGGEALLKFDLIRYAVEYIHSTYPDRDVFFDISTNGVLLDKDFACWFNNYENVGITCTVNGLNHDQYRVDKSGHGSLSRIEQNLLFIREHYPQAWNDKVRFLANVDSEREVSTILDYYEKMFGKKPVAITDIIWQNKDDALAPDYVNVDFSSDNALADYFIQNLWQINQRPIVKDNCNGVVPSCAPCEVKLFVHADGKLSFCETTCERAVIGDLKSGFNKQYIQDIYKKTEQLYNNKCTSCWAQRLCKICIAPLFDENGVLLDHIPEKFCLEERNGVERALTLYCQLSEEKPEALKQK